MNLPRWYKLPPSSPPCDDHAFCCREAVGEAKRDRSQHILRWILRDQHALELLSMHGFAFRLEFVVDDLWLDDPHVPFRGLADRGVHVFNISTSVGTSLASTHL